MPLISLTPAAVKIKIETYWNVNIYLFPLILPHDLIKIETYWNVNDGRW